MDAQASDEGDDTGEDDVEADQELVERDIDGNDECAKRRDDRGRAGEAVEGGADFLENGGV
jgi:hypothetical protein